MLFALVQQVVLAIVGLCVLLFLGNDDPTTTMLVFAALAAVLALVPICLTFYDVARHRPDTTARNAARVAWAALGLFFASFALALFWAEDDGAAFRASDAVVIGTALLGPVAAGVSALLGSKGRPPGASGSSAPPPSAES